MLHNPFLGYGPQKRFAEEQARNDWILNLDADEWLSEELRRELVALLAEPMPDERTVQMRTRIVYPGHDKPNPFADFHTYVRLYNRRKVRFRDSLAHDEVVPTADVVRMQGEILHGSFRSVAHVVTKMVSYFELQKRERKRASGRAGLRLAYEFPFQFLKYYLFRGHIFGGRAGFVYAMTLAFSRWLRLIILAGW